MCDTSSLMVFGMASLFMTTFHRIRPYLGCLCKGQGQIQLLNRPNLRRIRKQNYNKKRFENFVAIAIVNIEYRCKRKELI